MVRQPVQTLRESADGPAHSQHLPKTFSGLKHTQELSDTEITRGASNDDRLNELCEPEPLVGVVDNPWI